MDQKNSFRQSSIRGTIIVISVCVVMFLLECVMGGSQNTTTLMRLGAMNNIAVAVAHQWWRLFTAQFLHIGVWHLVTNIVMIYYMGTLIEPSLGLTRFLTIYLLSGIGGNLFSFAFGSDTSVSAGASTALFGLFGAVVALGLRHRDNPTAAFAARQAFVLALINLAIDLFLPNIDIWGHLGGLVFGFLLEFLLADRFFKKVNPKIFSVVLAILIFLVVVTVRLGMVINY